MQRVSRRLTRVTDRLEVAEPSGCAVDRSPVSATAVDTKRLGRLLGHPELGWLVSRLRQRLERGRPLSGPLVLSNALPEQRRALERLLGRRAGHGQALSLEMAELEAVLVRAGVASDLRSAVEALAGPVADRKAQRLDMAQRWAAAYAPLEPIVAARPQLDPWLEWVRGAGLLRRVPRGDPDAAGDLVRHIASVLDRLPCRGLPLSVLAAETTGDGHALDSGRALSALLLRAVARLGKIPEDGEGGEWRRTVWASVGVLCGELTNPVLVLNLAADTRTPTGRALVSHRVAGQPTYLTARQLLQDQPLPGLDGSTVYLCENPSVVAEAANRLGVACAPLVCLSGHPAAAATVLLRQLLTAGAQLRYHGDFDWPGVVIANGIVQRFHARAWRFDASAYRTAACSLSGGQLLRGRPVTATRDPELSDAMQTAGLKIEEERVLRDILSDLRP